MDQLADAETLRHWAQRCFAKAIATEDEEERLRLHQMAVALFEVAETRDWLDGRKSQSKTNAA